MIDVRTFRASNMQQALALVHRELGADAVILHTRELRRGVLSRWSRRRARVEVTAGLGMAVRSARPPRAEAPEHAPRHQRAAEEHFQQHMHRLTGMMEEVVRRSRYQDVAQLPDHFLSLYADLVDADVPEETARQLTFALHDEWRGAGPVSMPQLRARLTEMVTSEFAVRGPIQPTPGVRKVVALVGPTGVGKTTTIAKLAANFRLRDRQRVGLITVDTYRVAAVEHLRAYAEIIDLPMKVVAGSADMRWALDELDDMDLVLIDTAGRSPREELKIRELKALLEVSGADEVHLVLGAASSLRSLKATAEKFAELGVTAMLLTKLDEAASLGSLLALSRDVRLPLSYLTTGQNVPDDIEPADSARLARLILGQEQLRL